MPTLTIEDFPPPLQERLVCSVSAAKRYQVPANIILAIAEKEGGKPGQWKSNRNGTHDVGPMQFNTSYLHELARHGIGAKDVAAAGCYAFDLAAWRLRKHIQNDQGDIWTKAANYHSRTARHNTIYRADLILKAAKWADWLDARFVTYDLLKSRRTQRTVLDGKDGKPAVQHSLEEDFGDTAYDVTHQKAKASYVPRMLITKLGEPK